MYKYYVKNKSCSTLAPSFNVFLGLAAPVQCVDHVCDVIKSLTRFDCVDLLHHAFA